MDHRADLASVSGVDLSPEMRAIFIALGAAARARFDWMFLVFGLILVVTAVKILRVTLTGAGHVVEVDHVRSVRFVRRFMPVAGDYEGPRIFGRLDGPRDLSRSRPTTWPATNVPTPNVTMSERKVTDAEIKTGFPDSPVVAPARLTYTSTAPARARCGAAPLPQIHHATGRLQ